MGKLLDGMNTPADLRKLEIEDLPPVAYEIRHEIISILSELGYCASTLGAVELTLAFHYAFNTPDDRLVWDTGHRDARMNGVQLRPLGVPDRSFRRARRKSCAASAASISKQFFKSRSRC